MGLFDATMIVMGGIIGSGIFINPSNVARQVHTPFLILGVWITGGLIALAGAFIYAELAARCPDVGGQYAYLREAYHPSIAFIYGWALLLVTQTGGMAAVAVTFARYFLEITQAPLTDWMVAALALLLLTIINCLGVRAGSTVQNFLMVLKIVAIAALVVCGLFFTASPQSMSAPLLDRPLSSGLLTAIGAAMTPVMFAYGGWQTASFIAGEMREPARDLARGLLIGVMGVILLYTLVNFVCLYALGTDGLAATQTPASAVMRFALGPRGAALIAVGISISTLGFLSQGMLTAPRVYFAMASDGLFFKSMAWVDPRTRVPILAIVLQGALAIVIALTGKYDQILNYVVSVDFIWFGLTAATVFAFRRRAEQAGRLDAGSEKVLTVTGGQKAKGSQPQIADDRAEAVRLEVADEAQSVSIDTDYRVPGHPVTTILFIAACAFVVVSTIYKYPGNSAIGLMIVVAGIPVYFFWRWMRPRWR
ncbi:MAG TPA: amino acid permease [Pyrinomonadaceae bacterium]